MTEKEKMLSGMVYSAVDKQLLKELNAVKEVIHRYNNLSPGDNAGRLDLGTWQGIYLCEFRNHGGSRKIVATIYE